MSDPNQENDDTSSEVLKELRAENKRLKKEREELPAQLRAQIDREYKAQSFFDKVGYPKLASAFLKERADDELSDETVLSFLDEWGLEPRQSAPNQGQVDDLQRVMTFADRVQSKAKGQQVDIESELDAAAKEPGSVQQLANRLAGILEKQGAGTPGVRTRY